MHIPSSLSPHRLAITGMALLNALGTSVTEVWNNSLSMRSGICPLRTRFDDPPHFVDSAHFIPGINSYCGVIGHANLECTRQDLGLPPQDFRAMSTSTRMSLFMAKQAIEAAGLVEAGYDPQRVAVIVSQNSGESASTLWDVNLSVRGRWLAGLAAQVGQWSAEQQEDFYQRLTQGRVQPDESTMLYRLNCTAAGAICQRYGFEGPAFSVGAACSSSMAALYSAHNLIQAGIIDAAVVGGGEEGYAPLYFTEFSALGALARPSEYITTPEAHSRPFDLHRNGFVLGEGAAMIVVEREDLARKRSAPVHGMVTAVSNITNTLGLVEPSAYAQAQAIRHSFSTLDYGPEAVDLVECHATSTPLGDLAEAQSLRECFGHKQRPTVLSGYKAQIGHTTGASGLTSLIHGLCAMREGLFPGTLNYDSPDPALQLDEARLRILSTPETWETPATGIRRLQINTFGFGGSCFVAQVEEPNDRQPERMHPIPATLNPHTSRPQSLFQGQESLVDGARMISLPHQGRIWRLGATTPLWMNELAGLSAAPENAELTALSRRGLWLSPPVPAPAVAVMCCGQGSVWPGMGRALYDTFPAAREAMDRIAKVADWDILGLMDETSVDKIILTRWQQPYLFLLEYAQAHYLTTLGLKPVVMSGHSLGELIALCLAGVYTPETAWTILDTRSLFMAQVEAEASNETGMMSVHCSPEVLEATLKEWPELHVSNYNTPMQVILSGTRSLLQEVRKVLRKRRVPAMLLNVSLAFHHPHMRALREASLTRLHRLDFHAPALPMMSNITTGLYPQTKDEIINYIADLDENSVRWVECVRAMWNTYNIRHFVEMGPGDTLCGLVSDIENQAVCVATDRKGKEVEAMRSAVARLYALGHLPMRAGHGGPRPALAEKKPAAAPTSHEVYEEHIEKVMPIIAQATGYTREELQADMDLRHDLAIRSSRFPLIIHETERQFQIKLRFEDMLGVATIRDLADVLRKLQQQENTPATAKARPAEHAVEPPLPPVLRYSPDLQDIPLAEPKAVRVAALVLVTSQACAPLQHRLA
ncbi:MAG: beta-ketoacyl synthase N-terminal-like domain-containing protein, partial [Desulfovibrionaceae bacterium]